MQTRATRNEKREMIYISTFKVMVALAALVRLGSTGRVLSQWRRSQSEEELDEQMHLHSICINNGNKDSV